MGVSAGEYTTVAHTDAQQNLLTVEREAGQQVTYDPRRLQGVSVYREAEREFAEGDRVQFTAPSKDLHVANRELGTIVRLDQGGEAETPPAYTSRTSKLLVSPRCRAFSWRFCLPYGRLSAPTKRST